MEASCFCIALNKHSLNSLDFFNLILILIKYVNTTKLRDNMYQFQLVGEKVEIYRLQNLHDLLTAWYVTLERKRILTSQEGKRDREKGRYKI